MGASEGENFDVISGLGGAVMGTISQGVVLWMTGLIDEMTVRETLFLFLFLRMYASRKNYRAPPSKSKND